MKMIGFSNLAHLSFFDGRLDDNDLHQNLSTRRGSLPVSGRALKPARHDSHGVVIGIPSAAFLLDSANLFRMSYPAVEVAAGIFRILNIFPAALAWQCCPPWGDSDVISGKMAADLAVLIAPLFYLELPSSPARRPA